MNKTQFLQFLSAIHVEETHVYNAAQKEYAHGTDDVFANFRRVSGHLSDMSKESCLMVFALKHVDGICAYVSGHRSQREGIRGRIKDLRLYLALLWAMIEDEERQAIDVPTSDVSSFDPADSGQ